MVTCNTICTNALRKARQVSIGGTPSAEESAAALVTLQSIYDEFVRTSAFGRMEDVLISAAYTAGENERITSNGGPFAVTLPLIITDDPCSEDRQVRDYALVEVTGAARVISLFSAPLNAWQTLTGLTLTNDAPLAERSEDGLSALLAVRLAGDYGGDVSAGVALAASRFLGLITAKSDSAHRPTKIDYL